MKRLGNVQRKNRSPLLLKELLGEDGDDAMHGMKEKHLKSLAAIKMRVDTVRIVNSHFENKLNRRMDSLKVATEKSENGTFRKRNRCWKSQYKTFIANKRRKTNN